MDDIDKVLAAFGLKLVNSVVAAVCSFASLRFFDGLNSRDRWMTAIGGWAIAAWGAGPLREYFDLKPGVEVGLVILLAMFGMAAAAELIKLLRDAPWKEFIPWLRNKKNGNGG